MISAIYLLSNLKKSFDGGGSGGRRGDGSRGWHGGTSALWPPAKGPFSHEPKFLEAAQVDSPWGALASFAQPVDLGVIWLAFYVLDLRKVKDLSVQKWLYFKSSRAVLGTTKIFSMLLIFLLIGKFRLAHATIFINKRFALNEMFQRNASKFAIFYV